MQVAYSRWADGTAPAETEEILHILARAVFAGADAGSAWEQLCATGWTDGHGDPVYGIDELVEQLTATMPDQTTALERLSMLSLLTEAKQAVADGPPPLDGFVQDGDVAERELGTSRQQEGADGDDTAAPVTFGPSGAGRPVQAGGGSFSPFGSGANVQPLPPGPAMRSAETLAQLRDAILNCAYGMELATELRQEVAAVLGEPALSSLDAWVELAGRMQKLGLLARAGSSVQLSPAAMRMIGESALQDIFGNLDSMLTGGHQVPDRNGLSPDRGEGVVPYADGAAFDVDIVATLSAAVARGQVQNGRVELSPTDFLVHERADSVRVATVLLLDMSRSMPLRGYFSAAKKVAMAMDALVRSRFPRDAFYTVGFADAAREIPSSSLCQLAVEEFVYGTNIEHALFLARRLLARERGATRQVILVTDGEPTAHMEGERAVFAYPPVPATLIHTLAEVARCTRTGIRINTFMLDDSPELVAFVEQISRINSGRTFLARPDRLGEYVLLDYVTSRG